MELYKDDKVRAKRPAKPLLFIIYSLLFSAALTACQSDWRNGITRAEQPADISFTGSVVSSQMATRADGSIINLHEYQLPETKERSYYRYDADSKTVEEKKAIYYAGLFGCHTKEFLWKDLIKAYQEAFTAYKTAQGEDKTEADFLASNDFTTFKATDKGQAYSANLFYNQKMNIGKYTDGKDQMLTYDPIKFWPNNTFGGDNTHEYCTFWAYYPYNESGTQGTYGISVTPESMGTGRGLGAVKFTMHPDAAEQNDFLISEVVHDCNRDLYPLQPVVGATGNSYEPKPVPLRFHHMLAQVRIYAFIIGTDKLVYKDGEYYATGEKYTDKWGIEHTVTAEEDGKIKKIDETKSRRWKRSESAGSLSGNRKRSECTYKLEFNNLKTSCVFTPVYNAAGDAAISYSEVGSLGSTTVNHYIMNPYWFTFDPTTRERVRLNDNYMFGYYEDTPASLRQNATDADGINWSTQTTEGAANATDPLAYLSQYAEQEMELRPSTTDNELHYNYAPGNIILAVPQTLSDDDVPNIVITATGQELVWDPTLNGGAGDWKAETKPVTAKVTINMLKLGLKWESGYIYCYAFLDELSPGDDKVKGPESITTIFDPLQWTDQW